MRLLIFLLSISLEALPVITNAARTDTSAHGARFAWTTDVAATTKILLDTFDPPTTSRPVLNNGNSTTHVWFVSGLTPNTTYWYKLCSSDGAEACTASTSFTTSAAASGMATEPTAPTEVSIAWPAVNGTTFTVNPGCTNLQTQMDLAAGADGDLNHLVSIPAGAECVGQFQYKAKSGMNPNGTGLIYVSTNTTLFPTRTRIEPAYTTNYAKIISNYFHVYYQTSAPGTCLTGEVWVDSDAVSNWVNYCVTTNNYVAQTVTTGAGAAAGNCTEDAWYRNTSDANLQTALYWCTQTNKWRKITLGTTNNVVDWAALYPAANAKYWRFQGLIIQDLERPTVLTNLLNRLSGTGDERSSCSFCLAYISSTNENIVFDRVYFNGQGYPHRQQEAFCVADGSNNAVINSYFRHMNRWRPANAGESASHSLFILNGDGPWKIHNNYFYGTSGMSVFNSDDNPVGQMNDVTVTNNEFYVPVDMNYREPTNIGVWYYFRHHLELKRGERWLIKGNKFTGGFPGGNPNAASIGFTPTNGSPTALQCRENTLRIGDINVESNLFKYVPMALLGTAHSAGPGCNTNGGRRFRYHNNVTFNTGRSESGNTQGMGLYNFNGQHNEVGLGWEDFIFTNNTHINPTSAFDIAHFFNFGGDWQDIPNSRVRIENNLYYGTSIGYQWGLGISGSGIYGTAVLTKVIEPDSTYSYNGNARQRGQTGGLDNNPAYPGTNYSSQTPADFGPFVRCVMCGDIGDFRPGPTSKFQASSAVARGYDNKTAGPDFDKFDADLGTTINPRWVSKTTTSVLFAWNAPTTEACYVGVSTTSDFTSEARTVYAGTASRQQSLNVTGLTTGTLYYYRIYCNTVSTGTVTTK